MRLRLVVLAASLSLALITNAARAGGPIVSGNTVAGNITGPSYIESWTFSGTAGNRVLVTAITTSGALNTNIVLKAPGGGAVVANTSSGDGLDYQLASTGTFTLEIQDYALANAGGYALAFTNVTAGPLTGGGDTDGGAIVSSDIKTGTMSGPADMDCFTFTGTMGNRVLIDAVATSGAGFNTVIVLYPPAGAGYLTYTASDRLEAQLSASGTWTVVIEDNGNDTAGGYTLSMLNVTAGPITSGTDTDGGPIASNEIKNGTFQDAVDFDAYTFNAFAGNRVFISAIATGGSANTTLTLYPTSGGTAETYTSSGDVIDWQCATSGSYTVVVEDYGNAHTGTYTLSFLNLTAGPLIGSGDNDGGPMNSADVKTGTISGPGDFDVFTFQGQFGDRVLIDAIATAGASFNTVIALYPPNGGANLTYTAGDRLDVQLTSSGTWSVLIEDNGNDTPGSYQMSFLNVTTGPLKGGGDNDGGAITSDEIRNGQFQQPVDFDAYTFNGAAGQRVVFTAIATGGGLQNTNMTLYPPGGGTYETTTSSGDVVDWQLLQTGTYTLVVEDYGDDNAGAYTLSFLNMTAGPFTSASDSDGGPITSAQVKSGSMSAVGDLDAYTFTGATGDRIIIDAVATGGAGFNTLIALYPPAGAVNATYTTGDRLEYLLTSPGTWTILIEDNGNDTSGSYDLSLLNVTSGPHTSGSDADGGVLVSNTIQNGQFNQGVDLDAYTFSGTAGQRVILTALAVGGGLNNTNLTLYPPGGGVYETTTSSGDVIDWQLVQTGTYTVVVEDYGDDNAGAYTLSYLNLTAGPLTDGADPDGGAIASAEVKTGSMSGVGDLDAYTFSGTFGQRVLVDVVATGGASYNSSFALYPPNGGPAATYTTGDRLELQLGATGTWTLLVYDNGFDNPGNYELSLLNVTGGPITSGGDADGGAILSNQIKTGQFNQGVDFDAYTFSGAAGQRVVFTAVATGASNNTNMTLYPPGGLTNEGTTSADQMEVRLQRSGTYTLVLEDYGDSHTGAYTISYLNVTAGPLTDGGDANGGPIVSNQVVSGTMSGVADLDAYTISATYGQRILVDAVTTAGAGFNTEIVAYPPNGAAYFTYTTGDRLDFTANASGVWTIVIEDNGDDTPGGYTMSVLNVSAGPYSGSGETDGGPIADNVTKPGSIYSVADADGYTFYGVTGMTAHITAIVTSGAMDSQVALYPPNGGASLTTTTSDDISPTLPLDGYYTVVVEDAGADQTGNYSLKVDLSGGVTGVGDTPPAELALHGGVPSPFSQSTRIDYDLPAADHVRISVYDVTGARIRALVDENRPVGRFAATWDGRDDAGRRVASGVYYLRMETRAEVKNQKVVLVR
jgi:FlgD Ig-like domain